MARGAAAWASPLGVLGRRDPGPGSDGLQESPMSELEALIVTARAQPEEDGPRSVLADWLDDHGDPDWAELIRVQLEAVRQPPRKALAERAAALAERWVDRHGGPLTPWHETTFMAT